MEYTDTDRLYEQDERLGQLREALATESGETKSAVEKAIRRRKKELRQAHSD